MIRETLIQTATDDDPAAAPLRLHLDGDTARFTWTPHDPPDVVPRVCSVRVPARSLLLALRAAWDDGHPGAADLDGARPEKPPRERRPGPPNTRQPWTADLDAVLRDTWLGTSSTVPAAEVIGELATRLGRSRGGIRARLARTGCDPDVPGRTLRDGPALDSGGRTDAG